MIIFQMTYVGAPYIYYGDEAGMWGANDPDCRKPMIWPDIVYYPEIFLPDQSKKEISDVVQFDEELYEFYKKLIHIRNDYEELQIGNLKELFIDDSMEIYVYSRGLENNGILKEIIVVINKGKKARQVTIDTDHKDYYSDILDPNHIIKVNRGKVLVNLNPCETQLLQRNYYR